MKRTVSQIFVAIVCALLGFLLTYQFKELNSANSGNIDYNSSDILSDVRKASEAYPDRHQTYFPYKPTDPEIVKAAFPQNHLSWKLHSVYKMSHLKTG